MRFELGQQLRGLGFRIATGVLFGYWFFFTLKLGYDPNFWGLHGEVFHNAPVVLYFMLATQGFVAFVIVPVFMASPLLKDLQHRAAEWLYACPVSARGLFWGRFWAAFLALAVSVAMGSLGIVFAPHAAAGLGLVAAERVVRLPLAALLSAWCVLLLPSVFVGASLVYFRRG
ncbi:MAG: hypothetical protein MJD61_03605 [Proteobacteria bacterium]|nr:hypothetical protein [Pseudomonadota bacterium]